jgi:O-antigen/teichoic acid export membrane protein
LSTIRVRRSGLTALAVRLGSVLTGLIFVVLVTENVSSSEFGLWGLLSRVIGYVTGFAVIVTFWATRYRARGMRITSTALAMGGILSVILAPVFIAISILIAGSIPSVSQFSNLFYFLISSPQVPLYIVGGSLEYVIIGYAPVKAYAGFATFEISKVIIGFVAIGVLRLSLAGAIIAVMFAQIVQLGYLLFTQRSELSEKVSKILLKSMARTSWLTLLNTFQGWFINLDYLVVAILTFSTIPLGYYGAALTIANVIGAAAVLSAGLYPYILSGKDPTISTNQTLELQAIFIAPAVIGSIILSQDVLHLLNPSYVVAAPILYILSFSMFFTTIQLTFDNVVTGSDKVDVNENVSLSLYLKSKIFLMTRINLGLGVGYLAAVSLIGLLLGPKSSGLIFGYNGYVAVGIFWAFASLGMNFLLFSFKLFHARKVAKISISKNALVSILISSTFYSISLLLVSSYIAPKGSIIIQALYILLIGGISLTVYFLSMLVFNKSMKDIISILLGILLSKPNDGT